MNETMQQILIGAAGGAGATIIIGLFYGPIRYCQMRLRRREQIAQISNTIIEYKEYILFEDADTDGTPGNECIHDRNRILLYDMMRQELTDIVGYSFDLTVDQQEGLRRAFRPFKRSDGNYPPNRLWYVDTFKKAESLTWLNAK